MAKNTASPSREARKGGGGADGGAVRDGARPWLLCLFGWGRTANPPPPPVVCPLPIPPRRGPSSARHLGHIIWGALSRRVLAEVGRGPLSVAHLLPTLRRWPLQGPWLGAPADSWGRQPDWTAPCRVRGSSCTNFISQLPRILSVTRGRLLGAPFHVVDRRDSSANLAGEGYLNIQETP